MIGQTNKQNKHPNRDYNFIFIDLSHGEMITLIIFDLFTNRKPSIVLKTVTDLYYNCDFR